MALGSANEVPGCPGWYYGLRVTYDDGSCSFSVGLYATGETSTISGLVASKYRTSELAQRMGDERPGYEDVAVDAIRAFTGL